jgi:hypothetical protein
MLVGVVFAAFFLLPPSQNIASFRLFKVKLVQLLGRWEYKFWIFRKLDILYSFVYFIYFLVPVNCASWGL